MEIYLRAKQNIQFVKKRAKTKNVPKFQTKELKNSNTIADIQMSESATNFILSQEKVKGDAFSK